MFLESEQEDKKILDQIVAGITWVYSVFNFCMNAVLIC